MTTTTITIDGNRIHDIASFYEEINRVFMAEEDWKLAPSLDALHDMLYGAYGATQGHESISRVWENIEKSQADLGVEATIAYYQEKLRHPEIFNVQAIRKSLHSLQQNAGPTYFDIVLEIIAEHPHIKLQAA